MAKENPVYKAVIKREVGLQELESAVAGGGGIILRVDQRKGETVAFFTGSQEASKGVKTATAKLGQVEVQASSADELAKLP